MFLHGGKGLPEVTNMYGRCEGCVGAYHVVGGSVNGYIAAYGAVYVSYAAMCFEGSMGLLGMHAFMSWETGF